MRDTLSEDGAHEVARDLEFYWLIRGYEVHTRVSQVTGKRQNLSSWQVRSDMVNGQPVRAAQ